MKISLIARTIGAPFDGDPNREVHALRSLTSAGPDDLSFILSDRHLDTRAGVLICPVDRYAEFHGVRLEVDDPYLAYAQASALFAPERPVAGVHPTAVIGHGVVLGANVSIGPLASVGDQCELGNDVVIGPGCRLGLGCQVGAGSELGANVTLEHRVVVGRQTRIHPGAVIGAEGFGFAPSPQGWQKIHQLGRVVIGDDCEIGANTCIDRGALDDTRIGDGVKIDDQVMIAHNCTIGDRTAIAACVGMAGSTHIGADCTIAGAAGFTGHIRICDKVHVGAMTLVAGDILQPGAYAGGVQGARPMRSWKRNVARFNHLDELAKRLLKLEKLHAKS